MSCRRTEPQVCLDRHHPGGRSPDEKRGGGGISDRAAPNGAADPKSHTPATPPSYPCIFFRHKSDGRPLCGGFHLATLCAWRTRSMWTADLVGRLISGRQIGAKRRQGSPGRLITDTLPLPQFATYASPSTTVRHWGCAPTWIVATTLWVERSSTDTVSSPSFTTYALPR